MELRTTEWSPPKGGYRSDVEKYQDRAKQAKQHMHELTYPPVFKTIGQRQAEALESSRLLQFLDAAKRGILTGPRVCCADVWILLISVWQSAV